MSISLEQLSAQMRRGEQVPLRHTMQVVLTLSIPSILQQIVLTAVEYIDAAMGGISVHLLRHPLASSVPARGSCMECWPVYICPLPFRWHSIWVQTGRTMHAVYCANL